MRAMTHDELASSYITITDWQVCCEIQQAELHRARSRCDTARALHPTSVIGHITWLPRQVTIRAEHLASRFGPSAACYPAPTLHCCTVFTVPAASPDGVFNQHTIMADSMEYALD
jgi:hypothetical protein